VLRHGLELGSRLGVDAAAQLTAHVTLADALDALAVQTSPRSLGGGADSGGDDGRGAALVSPFLAWIGSPCLRHRVHGASIGGGPHPAHRGGRGGGGGAAHVPTGASMCMCMCMWRWGWAHVGVVAVQTPCRAPPPPPLLMRLGATQPSTVGAQEVELWQLRIAALVRLCARVPRPASSNLWLRSTGACSAHRIIDSMFSDQIIMYCNDTMQHLLWRTRVRG
jgi:hypothetical protein